MAGIYSDCSTHEITIASNEVIVPLVKSKCFPVLFYGLQVCLLHKFQYQSINYIINCTFSKIFNIRSQDTVDVCIEMFNCLKAEQTIAIRRRKFLNKFSKWLVRPQPRAFYSARLIGDPLLRRGSVLGKG